MLNYLNSLPIVNQMVNPAESHDAFALRIENWMIPMLKEVITLHDVCRGILPFIDIKIFNNVSNVVEQIKTSRYVTFANFTNVATSNQIALINDRFKNLYTSEIIDILCKLKLPISRKSITNAINGNGDVNLYYQSSKNPKLHSKLIYSHTSKELKIVDVITSSIKYSNLYLEDEEKVIYNLQNKVVNDIYFNHWTNIQYHKLLKIQGYSPLNIKKYMYNSLSNITFNQWSSALQNGNLDSTNIQVFGRYALAKRWFMNQNNFNTTVVSQAMTCSNYADFNSYFAVAWMSEIDVYSEQLESVNLASEIFYRMFTVYANGGLISGNNYFINSGSAVDNMYR